MKSLDTYVAYLAQQHAQNQESVAALLALALFPLWSLVQFNDLSKSMAPWLAGVLPRIQTAYTQSQRLSAVYSQNVRFASLPTDTPLPISAPDVERPYGLSSGSFDMPDPGSQKLVSVSDAFDTDRVKTSLLIQADYKTKLEMPGTEDDLMHDALIRSSGTAVREAINGSRNVSRNVQNVDRRRVIGWARVTDSKPCYFCALLASRGAVYAKDAFSENYSKRRNGKKSDADFLSPQGSRDDLPASFSNIAKVHDHCKCTLRPVYSKSQSMDHAAQYYFKNWDNTPGKNNSDQINNFRKWLKDHPYQGTQADLYSLKQDLHDRQMSLIQAGFSHDSPQVKWAAQQLNNLAA